jgi:hypothetical protein
MKVWCLIRPATLLRLRFEAFVSRLDSCVIRTCPGKRFLKIMIPDPRHKEMAQQLIEKCLNAFEQPMGSWYYEYFDIGAVGSAARLLGNEEHVEQAFRLFERGVPFRVKGVLKIGPVYERLRSIPTLIELEKQYPDWRKFDVLEYVRLLGNSEVHIALSLEQRYEEAYDIARIGGYAEEIARRVEEIAITQAILGDFDLALSSIKERVQPDFRQRDTSFLVMLELFRQGHFEWANKTLNDFNFKDDKSGLYDRIQLAISLLGRRPWPGYPYPDW